MGRLAGARANLILSIRHCFSMDDMLGRSRRARSKLCFQAFAADVLSASRCDVG